MRDLQIPACLDGIYDALQNIIALPGPYQDRFIKKCSNFREQKSVEKRSETAPQKQHKSRKTSQKAQSEKTLDFIQEFVDSGGPKSFQSVVNSSKIARSPTSEKLSNLVTFWTRV